MAKRVWIPLTVLALCLAFVCLLLLAWSVNEEHFDRPDAGFDRLTASLEELPGVEVEASERWVEAPTFSDPSAWISLAVDEAGLPAVLEVACASDYRDDVRWSLRVQTEGGPLVSVHSDGASDGAVDAGVDAGGAPCPDFGFDAVGLIDEAGALGAGPELQASVWADGRFALTSIEGEAVGIPALLALVQQSDALREAAGVRPERSVEIDAARLSVVVGPGEQERYVALLAELAGEHDVTHFWADGGGTPIDGVEKVQVVAPSRSHAAIERAIRDSGLHIAELPVRFLPESG